jgi:hypothetical protein
VGLLETPRRGEAIGSALAVCPVLEATCIGERLADDIAGPVPAGMEIEDLEVLGDGDCARGAWRWHSSERSRRDS